MKKLILSNSFMQLYCLSMGRLFKVHGVSENVTVNDVVSKGLVSAAVLGTSNLNVIVQAYSAITASESILAQLPPLPDPLCFLMGVDEKLFPVTLITDSVDHGNSHCLFHPYRVGHIAEDQFGNHYFALNNIMATLKPNPRYKAA